MTQLTLLAEVVGVVERVVLEVAVAVEERMVVEGCGGTFITDG